MIRNWQKQFGLYWVSAGLAVAALTCFVPQTKAADFDSFGTPPKNETTFSIGVYRLIVDTNTPWWTYLTNYPGFQTNGNAISLTGPNCYDPSTILARGEAYPWTSPILATGEPVGTSLSTIIKTADYAAVPSFFSSPPGSTRKLFTEMRSLVLVGTVGHNGSLSNCPPCPPPAQFPVPPPPPYNGPLIWAGAQSGSPIPLPISRGQVQSKSGTGNPTLDFPAQSFWDVFALVYLPPQGSWLSGAFLTNSDPLVVTNSNVTNFPPEVTYVHGETAAVPVYFANPSPYWTVGQRFGWMILAGHGVLSNDFGQVACPPCPVVDGVLTNAFGTNNDKTGMPLAVDYFYGTNLCPPLQVSYSSPLISITNKFPGAGGLLLRKVRHSNLPNPIPLPTSGGATYSASGTTIQFEISQNGGASWSPITAPANNVTITISNAPGAGPPRVFRTEMLALDIAGGNLPAGVMVRESPTKQSLGRHTVRKVDGGFRISSFFDVFLDVSLNNGSTWSPADSATTVALAQPESYTVVLQPGQTLIANQLDHGSNTVNEVIPTAPDGATFTKWNDGTGTFDPPETYFGAIGWEPGLATLRPGEIAFVSNPGPSPFPIIFTGVPHEYKVLSVMTPGSHHGLSQQSASVGTYESLTGCSPAEGSQVNRWDTSTQSYQTNRFTGGAWVPSVATLNIGEGAFVDGPIAAGSPCLTIVCPPNITVASPDGSPVNIGIPPATVNRFCGSAAVGVNYDPGLGPFPVGTTMVTVTATNEGGIATCSFTVTVTGPTSASAISIGQANGEITLNWTPPGTLQSADVVTGPYVDLDPAPTPPFHITPSRLITQQYYRLRLGQPPFTFYDTELVQLDIQGGTLPGPMRLRESPTLASTGKTAIQPTPSGGYIISSFFDVFTEISLDNGQTWSQPTNGPAHMHMASTANTNTLPAKEANYVSPADWHAAYAQGIYLTNASHFGFTAGFPPPPPGGITDIHSFSSTVSMGIKPCPTCPVQQVSAPAQVTVKVTSRP